MTSKVLIYQGNTTELFRHRLSSANTEKLLNPELEEVDLRYNPDADFSLVFKLNLKKLCLRGCELSSLKGLQTSRLEELDVSRNPLGHSGGLEISSLLQSTPTLLRLNVSDCDLSFDAFNAIIHASQNLIGLEISNPRIVSLGNEHCLHLASILAKSNISKLNLARATISDTGLGLLISGLSLNLIDLDLSGNQLSFRGAAEIGKLLMLEGNKLARLNLHGNRLGCNGDRDSAVSLAEGLRHGNCNLYYLDLGKNSFSGRALEIIGRSALSKLTELVLFENHWDEEAIRNFQVLMQSSSTRVDFGIQEVPPCMHIFQA